MPLKLTRLEPGLYETDVHGVEHVVTQNNDGRWVALVDQRRVAEGKTKREVVSRLEILARQPQDRTVSDSLKLFRRGEIKVGTKLTLLPKSVPNLRGKVDFVSYTKKDDGSEWIEVEDNNGRHRYVRPETIKTVHRK